MIKWEEYCFICYLRRLPEIHIFREKKIFIPLYIPAIRVHSASSQLTYLLRPRRVHWSPSLRELLRAVLAPMEVEARLNVPGLEKQFSLLRELPGSEVCIIISIKINFVIDKLTWAGCWKLSQCSSTEWDTLQVEVCEGVVRKTELCEQKQRGMKQH